MIFKRKIYDTLLKWKQDNAGRTAALIKGARRVGKSTVVEEFARNEYESYILIDFTECRQEVRDLFDDLSDLDYIFMRLQLIYNVDLIERKSVIIFDEVQTTPRARQAIKHLVKDHRYDYIETGSLISIRKNIQDIVIPSEEVKFEMYPMDYEEFRWALGDTATVPLLRQFWEGNIALREAHRKVMRDFRLYMLVGGMPQAVSTYLETNNLAKVDEMKRTIISLYENDFNRIDSSGIASDLFHRIPSELTRNARRYLTWSATGGVGINDLSETIIEMRESMVVNIAYHANNPGAGMALYRNNELFKMYVGDTGLFVTLAFWDKTVTDNVIYNKLLSDKLSADLGYVYENIVAQILKASGKELYYYTFPTESGKHNYEIDFLIADGDKVSPIEVKSSGYKTHASLDAFCKKFSARIRNKYLLYTKDYAKDEDVIRIPFYMAMFL
ncbi:MAG: AAA family ATPase [Bacteroidales bacterium]|nr:AAA family ATPase [Bacteroidales bacterium]